MMAPPSNDSRNHHEQPAATAPTKVVELATSDLRASAAERLATIGGMTSGVVHDLVNVLSVIDISLRLAELNAGVADTAQRVIAKARGGVDYGFRLASKILEFAKQ
jgi:hypothetical protein